MLKTHNPVRHNRVPASARTAGAVTTTLWGLAVLLFAGQAEGQLPLGAGAMQLIVYWLLAFGCTAFWCTFMRVGEELVHTDWRIAYELDREGILAPGRDRHLDSVLARGLAADRPPDFWPTGIWKLFRRIGATFWVISAVTTAAIATGYLSVTSPQRGILLVILMIPAVQCTAAGVIGPGLTRMLELREGAREARRLLCEQGERYDSLRALNHQPPEPVRDSNARTGRGLHPWRPLGRRLYVVDPEGRRGTRRQPG